MHVRGILENYPNVDQPTVYMSRDTLRLLGMGPKNGKTGPPDGAASRDPAQAEPSCATS